VHRLVSGDSLVELIGVVHRAVLDTGAAAGALVLDDVPGLGLQGYPEITLFSLYLLNFGKGENLDVRMPADLDQFR
jgi:hypothetical protein